MRANSRAGMIAHGPSSRRRLVLATISLCVALSVPALADAQPRPLNVVLILADDLGYGDLACYGHPTFKTPRIDRLAAQGCRLTQAYVPVPYCAPTRGALITGRYPIRNGLTSNPLPIDDQVGGSEANDAVGLPLSEVTLGDLFHQAGYRTACFGKWHLGHQPPFRPLKRGFDQYLGILYSNDMHRVELFEDDRMIEYPVVQATLTTRLAARAVEFLERNADQPFFLYLPHHAVHKPLFASEAYYQKTGTGLYGDCLGELDWAVGEVLDTLDRLQLADRTLVVFTSDNGPSYGGSSGPLRGMKAQTWEGGLRVPMIARWPGVIPPGTVRDQPVIVLDLLPTLLNAAGIPLPENLTLDGRDIRRVLQGDPSAQPHEVLFAFKGNRLASVRDTRWKLHVLPPGGSGRDRVWLPDEPYVDPRRPDGVRILAPYEQAHPSQFPGLRTGPDSKAGLLFDLQNDPAEQHDVAAQHPAVVQRLGQAVESFLADIPPASQP